MAGNLHTGTIASLKQHSEAVLGGSDLDQVKQPSEAIEVKWHSTTIGRVEQHKEKAAKKTKTFENSGRE